MEKMTWKTKLIIAAIVVALLLALASLAVGGACGWYAKYIYDKYFKTVQE